MVTPMQLGFSAARPRVTFVGPVQVINGLGVSARGYVSALTQCGATVHVEPWIYGFEAVNKLDAHFNASGRGDINIIHLNLDLLSSEGGLLNKQPLAGIMGDGRYNILIPYWELASLRPEWLPIIEQFDEIWCASKFMQKAFGAVCRRPVNLLRPMIAQAAQTEGENVLNRFGLELERFSFFYAADTGSTFGRKNPKLLWRSYLEEFSESEGAACILKLHYAYAEDPRVKELVSMADGRKDMRLVLESLSVEEMATLQRSANCYVSPHRSEGLGLTVIEAMLAGQPVIATPYGGAADFVSSETAFPIEYFLTEVGPGNGPYQQRFIWAEPNSMSLRRRMREVFTDQAHSRTIAEAGQAWVHKAFGLETAAALGIALDRVAGMRRVEVLQT